MHTRPASHSLAGWAVSGPLLMLLLLATGCAAQGPRGGQEGPGDETNVAPGINEKYTADDINVESWVERFSGESREVYVARAEVLDALGLEPGDRVADVGAGTGLFTQPLAAAVGSQGKVYAVDISKPFLDLIAANAAADGLAQVETVLGEDRTSNLADASVDVVFHCDTYHHFEYPKTMTRDLARALGPGGKMFVLDFERIPGTSSPFILRHVRAAKQAVIAEIEASGFDFEEEIELPGLEENYLLRFRKSASR